MTGWRDADRTNQGMDGATLLDRSPAARHTPPARMSNSIPPGSGVSGRGSIIHGFREAAVDLWGEKALAHVGERLPMATRVATLDEMVLPFAWLPIEHVVHWHDAVWSGPARADEGELARFISRSIDLGLGRFKSAFFSGVTPDRLIERAQQLWRYQHSHGDVTVAVDGTTGTVTLRDHPYVNHATSRRVTAESYRHIVGMAGGKDVRAAWGVSGTALVVQLSWRA
jgi:hypothetical protein